MWVAVPGRDLMIFGNKPHKSITLDDVRDQVAAIADLKVFNQVISKSDASKGMERHTSQYLSAIAEDTLGTVIGPVTFIVLRSRQI